MLPAGEALASPTQSGIFSIQPSLCSGVSTDSRTPIATLPRSYLDIGKVGLVPAGLRTFHHNPTTSSRGNKLESSQQQPTESNRIHNFRNSVHSAPLLYDLNFSPHY